MKVRILTDSTADLTPQVQARVGVIPMTVRFGETEYLDGVTLTHQSFYEKLVETDTLPTTSQATPASFLPLFEEVAAAGDSAVVLTLSSQLSGTYQSACMAAQDYENIYVVDTLSVAIGSGILVELALQLADAGLSARQIAETLERRREDVCLIAMVDTLEYLKKGGRISKTVAFAGELLNIKPVVAISEGKIVILGKARGSRQANNLLVTQIEKAGGVDFEKPLLLGYTGLSDRLLQKYIDDSKALWQAGREQVPTTQIGSVIGAHAGPGAVAVAFFRKES